jgi:hypothetical protein
VYVYDHKYSWIVEHSYLRVNQIHQDLLTAYQNDFAKYPARIAPERLREVMLAIPRLLSIPFYLIEELPRLLEGLLE